VCLLLGSFRNGRRRVPLLWIFRQRAATSHVRFSLLPSARVRAAERLLICLPFPALGFAHRRAAVQSGFQSRALDLCAAAGRFSFLLVLPKPTSWFGPLGQKLLCRAPSPPDSPARESLLRSSTGGDCGRCCLSPQFPQTECVLPYVLSPGAEGRRTSYSVLHFDHSAPCVLSTNSCGL
jgi:hypothetical protein